MTLSSSPSALDISPQSSAPVARTGFSLRDLLREPLLHFIVLGGLLFAVDHFLVSRADDPRTIVVGPEVDSEAIEIFEETRQRKPNAEELKALHQVWLDNEVLYREGLTLQVDKGDPVIRERVIFKALSMIEAGIKLPPIDDKGLHEWFEKHREKYDDPARYNFQEAILSGDKSESVVRNFVATLNTGTPGDAQAGLHVFKDRPLSNIEQSYGDEFRKNLDVATAGVWQALHARDGWHAVRIDSIIAPKPADFDALHNVILQDWKDATAADMRTAAVRELSKKYRIKFETRAE